LEEGRASLPVILFWHALDRQHQGQLLKPSKHNNYLEEYRKITTEKQNIIF
jgi:hypothetical protein